MEPKALCPSAKIVPLALPKGTERLCELCQNRAHLQCIKCRVTFYCDEEHQRADWKGIHERICQLLVPIRTTTILKQVGRTEILLKKAELIKICRVEAQRKLCEGKYQEALPAAQFSLRCAIDVHGLSDVQLIPAYLLLADANMGAGNLPLVMELLSQAEWAVLKSSECTYEVRQWLHRSLGRLHAATGNLEKALLDFANDIYFACEIYGVDSTVPSGGYFLMAEVFVKQGKMPTAFSLYSEVARTWHSCLSELLKTHAVDGPKNPNMFLEPPFDKTPYCEVDKMLNTILEFEQNDPIKKPRHLAVVAHSLAMLWFLRGDSVKAAGFGSMALQASQRIQNHDLREAIEGLLQLAHSDPRVTGH